MLAQQCIRHRKWGGRKQPWINFIYYADKYLVRLTKTTKSNQVRVPDDFRKENIPNTSRKQYRLSYLAHFHSLYPQGKTPRYPMTRSASKNRFELKLDTGRKTRNEKLNKCNWGIWCHVQVVGSGVQYLSMRNSLHSGHYSHKSFKA